VTFSSSFFPTARVARVFDDTARAENTYGERV